MAVRVAVRASAMVRSALALAAEQIPRERSNARRVSSSAQRAAVPDQPLAPGCDVFDAIGVPGPEPQRQGSIAELDRPLVGLCVRGRPSAAGERLEVLARGVEAEPGGELEDVRRADLERRLHARPSRQRRDLGVVAVREPLVALPARAPTPSQISWPRASSLGARRLDGAAHADVVGAAGEQLVAVRDQRDRGGDPVDVAAQPVLVDPAAVGRCRRRRLPARPPRSRAARAEPRARRRRPRLWHGRSR